MKAKRQSTGADGKSERGRTAAVAMAGMARWIIPLAVAAITVLVFLPSLKNGFVNWDDDRNFLDNPDYRGLGWTQLGWMFTTFHIGHYQPLSWMTLGLDYLLWGMNPAGYHLTNVLLHAASAVLFYFLMLRLLGLTVPSADGAMARVSAGFAALLFAVHPLRVESVAWVTERRDVLSGFFILLTVLCYLRAVTGEKGDYLRWMIAALAAYGLSLLSKAAGMTLPLVLLVLDVYPLKRLGGTNGRSGAGTRKTWLEKIPFFALALAGAAVALWAQRSAAALRTVDLYGVGFRAAQAAYGLIFYLWKTVLPARLAPLYELPIRFDPWDWKFVLSGAAVLALTAGLYLARRRWPAGLASWACYVFFLAPVLGAAQSGPQLVADRYSYLSCLAWAALAGGGALYALRAWARKPNKKFILAGAAAVVILGCCALTGRQIGFWRDSERLWRRVLDVEPNSSLGHNNLAGVLARRGALDEAIEHYRRATEINPRYVNAYDNLARVLFQRGEVDAAIAEFRRALEINPNFSRLRSNLGAALVEKGELDAAVREFQRAAESNPAFAEAHFNLGMVAEMRGDTAEAIRQYNRALAIDPAFVEAHQNLGALLAKLGKGDEATAHYQEAMRLGSGDVPAR